MVIHCSDEGEPTGLNRDVAQEMRELVAIRGGGGGDLAELAALHVDHVAQEHDTPWSMPGSVVAELPA